MESNQRKFWSRETLALIVGMSSGMGISNIVHSKLGITGLVPEILVSIVCVVVFLTLAEWVLVSDTT